MVCLHTGFAQPSWTGGASRTRRGCIIHAPASTAATKKLLRWIDESGLSVLIADNLAVEHIHTDPPATRRGPRRRSTSSASSSSASTWPSSGT
jgi:predicted anti-sigma-YlaC factor YlaD